MFRCCSLETSHPRLLPQSLKDCSVHTRLFFCSAYRVIINIFLNSIYILLGHQESPNIHIIWLLQYIQYSHYHMWNKIASGKLLHAEGAQWWPRGVRWGQVVGGRLKRKRVYVYTQLIHFIVKQKLTRIVKQLYSKFFKKSTMIVFQKEHLTGKKRFCSNSEKQPCLKGHIIPN